MPSADIKAEVVYKNKPKMLNQFQQCETEGIPFSVIVGPDELAKGIVKVRNTATREEQEVARQQLGSHMAQLLSAPPSPAVAAAEVKTTEC